MPAIHLFGGEKGGVGKSFVCRTAIAYHLDREIDCVPFDADRSNADVLRIYGKTAAVRSAILSEGEDYEKAAHDILTTALDGQRVLVNLPAQAMPALSFWIDQHDIFEMADDGEVTFVSWFVSDCSLDSIKLFEQLLDQFDDNVHHVFVANHGKTKKWGLLRENAELIQRMRQMDVTLIHFPKFIGEDDCKLINRLSLPFNQVLESDAFDAFGRQHVRSFLRKAFAQFDDSEVFDAH